MSAGHILKGVIEDLAPARPVHNVECDWEWLDLKEGLFPLTLHNSGFHDSYVGSFISAYLHYGWQEYAQLSPVQSKVAWPLKQTLLQWLKWSRFNQTVSVNNWLFSTSLHPNWSEASVQKIGELVKTYPAHSLSIRSLNQVQHADLIASLMNKGWVMLPARRIYWFDKLQSDDWYRRNNNQNDRRLLKKTNYVQVEPHEHTDSDFHQVYRLVKSLFIEKHSEYNPHFSQDYLHHLHSSGLVEFYSFRDPDTKLLVATMGVFSQFNTLSIPLIGYDITLPQSLGLYRMLIAWLLRMTFHRNLSLNLSSGAGHFKRQRGGKPVIEYTALYLAHLPKKQQIMLQAWLKPMQALLPKALEYYDV